MRYQDGSYVCTLCGEKVRLAPDDEERFEFRQTSGKPTVRVVFVGTTEVHRCEEPASPTERPLGFFRIAR